MFLYTCRNLIHTEYVLLRPKAALVLTTARINEDSSDS